MLSGKSNQIDTETSYIYLHGNDPCIDIPYITSLFSGNLFKALNLATTNDLSSLDSLKGTLTSYPRFDLDVHGGNDQKGAFRFTIGHNYHLEPKILFKKIAKLNGNKPVVFVFWGCLSEISKDAKYLPEGSIIRSATSKNFATFQTQVNFTLTKELKFIAQKKPTDYFSYHLRNLPLFLTSTFNFTTNFKGKSYTFIAKPIVGRNDKHGLIYESLGITKYWTNQRNLFDRFLRFYSPAPIKQLNTVKKRTSLYSKFTSTYFQGKLSHSTFEWLLYNFKIDKLEAFLEINQNLLDDSLLLKCCTKAFAFERIHKFDELISLLEKYSISETTINKFIDNFINFKKLNEAKFFYDYLASGKLPKTLAIIKKGKIETKNFILYCLKKELTIAGISPLNWAYSMDVRLNDENHSILSLIDNNLSDNLTRTVLKALYELFHNHPETYTDELPSLALILHPELFTLLAALQDNILEVDNLNLRNDSEFEMIMAFLKLLQINEVYEYFETFEETFTTFIESIDTNLLKLLYSEECIKLLKNLNLQFERLLSLYPSELSVILNLSKQTTFSMEETILGPEDGAIFSSPNDIDCFTQLISLKSWQSQDFAISTLLNAIQFGNAKITEVFNLSVENIAKFTCLFSVSEQFLTQSSFTMSPFQARCRKYDQITEGQFVINQVNKNSTDSFLTL